MILKTAIDNLSTSAKVLALQKSYSESTCDMSSEREYAKKKARGNNVWYRHVLKPLLWIQRSNRAMEEAFTRRVYLPAGIPVEEFHISLHDACSPEYSPFIGLLFARNNMIENLYKYGDLTEPLTQLVHHLFHMLPGGEIQPTHVHRNATAHLSAAIVGALLEEWHRIPSDQHLAARFQKCIAEHKDYQAGRKEARDVLEKAQQTQRDLIQKDEASEPYRDEIKRIEGDVIKYNKHLLKRMGPDESEEEKKIIELIIEKGKQQVEELRAKYIVTSADKKEARKAVKRAEDALKQEQENLKEFAQVLAACFGEYEASSSDKPQSRINTTAILLAFMWRKYDHLPALGPYYQSLRHMGKLKMPIQDILSLLDRRYSKSHALVDNDKKRRFRVFGRVRRPSWPSNKVVEATLVVAGPPSALDRPPVIPFSYVTWAAYSKFPDCGETALRNLMNQILFRADTQMFDADLLVELKEKYYPDISPRLIRFYQRNSCPRNATDQAISLEWINVASKLNTALNITRGPRIRYRREELEQNIASPLSNLMRVMNALFGIQPVNDMAQLLQLINRINELRPRQRLNVDLKKIKPDGFGTLSLSVIDKTGKMVKYELHSYKPVHFGFIQAHSSSSQSSDTERYEYDAFRKLMRYASGVHNPLEASIEDLGLASLYVPYQLQNGFVGKYFRRTPIYYPLLFANLEDDAAKQCAIDWAKARYDETKSPELAAWISRIENYVAPSFGPIKEVSEEV
ncbi:hypothetical protein FisN_13Hh259 [Fistulifera solaris]|uniref:Uncharacterized protein n=1 Tax=Fistulifera solaris TaxID=1519565 RepID=A0A1Z5KMY9_FISSO|nr:hypothetical protein FisN_13Hh259 [Fistulifera solaris]|eukprot:GAX27649.1 hypothetical protein FisN_13Hh259 [Fistulifera solaris]